MKTLLAGIALSLSFGAFAESVSFSYSGMETWGQSFYSCDYVQTQTEHVLEIFGATDVHVNCFGGVEFGRMSPVSVNATFELPILNGAVERLSIKGDRWTPSCGVNVAIIKNLLPVFTNVTVLSKNDSCMNERSNYSYQLEIAR